VWLIVHELSFYVLAQKKNNRQKNEILGIYKERMLLPFQHYLLEIAKKGTTQYLVPKHHLAVFLVVK